MADVDQNALNDQRVKDAQAAAAQLVDDLKGEASVDAPGEWVARPAVEGEVASPNDPAEEE